MAKLEGRPPKESYPELLKINNDPATKGLTGSLQSVEDGQGVQTPLAISTHDIAFHGKVWPSEQGTPGSFLSVGSNETNLEWRSLKMQPQNIHSYFPGQISPIVGTVRWYAGKSITLTSVFAYISVAPSTLVVIDIKKNGTSIYGSGDKMTLLPNNHHTAVIPINVPLIASDYLTVDIVSGDGNDLTIRIEYQ